MIKFKNKIKIILLLFILYTSLGCDFRFRIRGKVTIIYEGNVSHNGSPISGVNIIIDCDRFGIINWGVAERIYFNEETTDDGMYELYTIKNEVNLEDCNLTFKHPYYKEKTIHLNKKAHYDRESNLSWGYRIDVELEPKEINEPINK